MVVYLYLCRRVCGSKVPHAITWRCCECYMLVCTDTGFDTFFCTDTGFAMTNSPASLPDKTLHADPVRICEGHR